tara:strand:- start:1022 stop:1237 length:216 start_codon:yes stop_codon:yes gene_type:complete
LSIKGFVPESDIKGAKPMANEESTNSRDFIVVGGRRRWFSVPDKDERFSELQQRVIQERDLAIPERPPEIS